MKVLLLEDVYKLGRAGDVKKVADGYGRNFLIPQGLAVLATPGALKQVEHIRTRATASRSALNQEMSGVAERLSNLTLAFPARAGETGKLYGSISTQMVAEAIQKKVDVTIDRRQIDAQPIRSLGEQKVRVRLTVDLVPEVRVVVYREGEAVDLGEEAAAVETHPEEEASVETSVETSAETPVDTSEEASVEAEAAE
jgi:large subunit ribosomal protein L9